MSRCPSPDCPWPSPRWCSRAARLLGRRLRGHRRRTAGRRRPGHGPDQGRLRRPGPVLAGMGDLTAKVGAGRRLRRRRRRDGDPDVDLGDAGGAVDLRHRGRPRRRRQRVGSDPGALGRRAVPDRGRVPRRHTLLPDAATSSVPADDRWSPGAPVVRFGIDKTKVPAARGRARRRRSPRCSTSTRRRTRSWSRPPGPRRSSRRWCCARGDAGSSAVRLQRHPGRACRSPVQHAARPDPRTSRRRSSARVGPATAEIIEGVRRRDRGRRRRRASGLQARYDEQLARHARAVVSAVAAPRAPSDRAVQLDEVNGEPLETTLDTASRPRPRTVAGRRRPGQRRSWRSGPRPATILAAASGPGTEGLQHRDVRAVRPGLDLQGRHRAGAAAGRG